VETTTIKDWREQLKKILSRGGGPNDTPGVEVEDWRHDLADYAKWRGW